MAVDIQKLIELKSIETVMQLVHFTKSRLCSGYRSPFTWD